MVAIDAPSCPSCGQEICSDCGSALIGDLCPTCGSEFESYCPRCQRVVASTATICPGCGLVFDE
jgi:RNA polymerase subunit RPABC4/transcription elongation factor Spt4